MVDQHQVPGLMLKQNDDGLRFSQHYFSSRYHWTEHEQIFADTICRWNAVWWFLTHFFLHPKWISGKSTWVLMHLLLMGVLTVERGYFRKCQFSFILLFAMPQIHWEKKGIFDHKFCVYMSSSPPVRHANTNPLTHFRNRKLSRVKCDAIDMRSACSMSLHTLEFTYMCLPFNGAARSLDVGMKTFV